MTDENDRIREYTVIGDTPQNGMVIPFDPGESGGRRIVFPGRGGRQHKYRPVQNDDGFWLVEDIAEGAVIE